MKKRKTKLELKKLKIAKLDNLSSIVGGTDLQTAMLNCIPQSFPPFLCTVDTVIGDESTGIC